MTAFRFVSLAAISCLALFAFFCGATPTNALARKSHHVAQAARREVAIAHKRGTGPKRCKARPQSTTSTWKPATATANTWSTPSNTHKAAIAVQASPTTSTSNSGSQSGGSNNKVGLAWNADPKFLTSWTPHASLLYTWSPDKPVLDLSIPFAPMLWGYKQAGDFHGAVVAGYAHYAMGMNEPNEQSQSNMSPEDAASLWRSELQPLKNLGYTLISPACTSSPTGIPWLQRFFAVCPDCTVDIIAFHYYGTSSQDMINYIKLMKSTFNKPMWITEFAAQSFSGGPTLSQPEVVAFMRDVVGFMNGEESVDKYFAFGVLHDMGNVNPANQLMGADGQPNGLGMVYLGLA